MDLETIIKRYKRVNAVVDLDAIKSNLENMKENIAPDTKIIGVIKTDGYGHGAVPLAREMESLWYLLGFATATVEEAVILRKSGITKPILILGYTFPYCYADLVEGDIRPTLFQYETAKQLSDQAVSMGKTLKVHIKVDTGMHRIGLQPDETGLSCIASIKELPGIEIEGIFTHFARADEKDKSAAQQQLRLFQHFIDWTESSLSIHIPVKHCSNSAGIVELKEANMDAVRAGITLYGLWPSSQVSRDIICLKPALKLVSTIVYIKTMEPGNPVSYGGTFVTDKKTRIATIPVGYGDGYPRSLSNKGYVLICGEKAPILGRVCMDQFMVDVTDIPEAEEGDEVVLIGTNGQRSITMEELGDLSGRFNYELACDIGKRVPRIYCKGGKAVGAKDYFDDFQ